MKSLIAAAVALFLGTSVASAQHYYQPQHNRPPVVVQQTVVKPVVVRPVVVAPALPYYGYSYNYSYGYNYGYGYNPYLYNPYLYNRNSFYFGFGFGR